jgi:hypothetical protein
MKSRKSAEKYNRERRETKKTGMEIGRKEESHNERSWSFVKR